MHMILFCYVQDVTIWAMKDVRELSAIDPALKAAARSVRAAAFATAAACIAATQDKEGLFANPLKPPGKSADPAGFSPNTHVRENYYTKNSCRWGVVPDMLG